MNMVELRQPSARRLTLYTVIAACIWSLLFVSFLVHDYLRERERDRDTALAAARVVVQRDGQWIAAICDRLHVSATQPSEKRTPGVGSERVTASTPAQLHPLSVRDLVDVMNQPVGTPLSVAMHYASTDQGPDEEARDAWDQASLQRIRQGEREVYEEYQTSDTTFLRLMAVLDAESLCVSSHGQQQGATGALIGALSVAVPIRGIHSAGEVHSVDDAVRFAAVWLFGMMILFLTRSRAKARLDERERVQAALEESNRRYERIVSTEHVGIWELDEQANTLFVNRRMAAMLGYTTEEMLGRSMFEFLGDEDRGQAARNFERRMQGIEEQHELCVRRRDGSPLWTLVSTRVVLDEQGHFKGTLGIITDISDRKRIEDNLKTSEELLRMLVESTDDVITMQDLDGRYLYFNGATTRYGVTESEIVQRRPQELFDPETAKAIMDRVREVAETGESLEHEFRLHWRGEEMWLQSRLYPVRYASGQVRAVSTFSRNITQQKQAQEKLREAQERLKIENLRARIAADLHDDIGSTLSSTSIFAAMLRRQMPARKGQKKELLARIEKNLVEVQESLYDIIWSVNPENDSLEDIILKMQEYAREVMDVQGIVLHLNLPAAGASQQVPMAGRRLMYLVFKEAVNNVVRHSRCTEATLSVSVTKEAVTITVSDNGRGFDPDKAARGNGLSNMRHRARSIGGTLEIRSGPGIGTAVRLRIPIA